MLDAFSLFDEGEYNFFESPSELRKYRNPNLKTDIEMFNEYKDFVKSRDSLVDEYNDAPEPYMLSINKDPGPQEEDFIVDLDSVPGVLEFRSRFRQCFNPDSLINTMDKNSSYNLLGAKQNNMENRIQTI